MEEGNSLNSKPEADAATTAIDVMAAAEAKEMKKLEQSIQKLALNDNATDNSTKEEQLAKLEVKRNELADEERRVRKAAWIAESRKEVLQRRKFRESRISDHFPDLVWEAILTKLDDDSEKARLSNLNLVWRAVLKRERTTFLFKEVFPLLHVGVYLERNDILNCRAVCHQWNKMIEGYIENYFGYRPASLLESRGVLPHPSVMIEDMDLRFRVEASRLVNYMQWRMMMEPALNGNPIFSRKIRFGCICPHDSQTNRDFWTEAGSLLNKWGGDVWLLAVKCSRFNFFTPVGIFDLTRNVLQLVPNLKQFNILGINQMGDTAELKTSMEGKPLPEMSHLRTLNLQYIPLGMLKLILNKYRATLKTVMIEQDSMKWSDFAQIQFPKLEYFFAGLNYFSTDKPSKLKLDWPSIQEINLQCEDMEPSGIPELFQNLDQVGETLKRLSLTLQKPGKPFALDPSVIRRLSLELPHLEEFSLTMYMGRANLKTIDFILPMSSLKELDLCYIKSVSIPILGEPKKKTKKVGGKGRQEGASSDSGTGASSCSGEIIQFWEYAKCMYDSNIWKLFPKLRKLTITSFIVDKMPEQLTVNLNVGPTFRPLDGYVNRNQFKKVCYTRAGYVKHCAERQQQQQ